MPFLRDEGPPVSRETIEEARRSLPVEYGYRIVSERGRKVVLVRVPHPRPDYLHELAEVALYVSLEEIKDAKDILLVGDEKVCRLEPVLLRDHIRERRTEDATVAQDLMRKLDRNYGYTIVDHKFNMSQHSVAVRVPRVSVADLTAEDVQVIRQQLQPVFQTRLRETQAAYIVADGDFERLGRRVFLELVDPSLAQQFSRPPGSATIPRPGVLIDKARLNAPTGVMPSGGLPMPAQTPPTAQPSFVPQPWTTPPPTQSTFHATPSTALPTDPAARSFVQSALSPPPAAPANQPTSIFAPSTAPSAPVEARVTVPLKNTDEFEVFVSKPRNEGPLPTSAVAPPPPTPTAPAASTAPPAPTRAVPPPPAHVFSTSPFTAPDSTPTPNAGFVQTVHHDEYEVFVSKRVSPEATPVERSRDEVTDIVAAAARQTVTGPAQDSGEPMVVGLSPSAPKSPPSMAPVTSNVPDFDQLAGQLEEVGYKVVRALEVEGTTFDLAAHRDNGKKVLAKAMPRVGATEVKALALVCERLGADCCILVAPDVASGARLASWGTPVEVLTPQELREMPI